MNMCNGGTLSMVQIPTKRGKLRVSNAIALYIRISAAHSYDKAALRLLNNCRLIHQESVRNNCDNLRQVFTSGIILLDTIMEEE